MVWLHPATHSCELTDHFTFSLLLVFQSFLFRLVKGMRSHLPMLRQASVLHFQKALSINPQFTKVARRWKARLKAGQPGQKKHIYKNSWLIWLGERALQIGPLPCEPISCTARSCAVRSTLTEAMNNMACAAGLGAITGILPQEYYQHAINALDQVAWLVPCFFQLFDGML